MLAAAGHDLRITPLPNPPAGSLAPYVSLRLKDARIAEVFHALGDALGVGVAIDLRLGEADRMNLSFDKAETVNVLNVPCQVNSCEWEFDGPKNILSFARKR